MGSAAELERRRCRAVQAVGHGQSPEAVADARFFKQQMRAGLL